MQHPNHHADQIEYFLPPPEEPRLRALSACTPTTTGAPASPPPELGLMAGAERVEGTLFGNGERTGNADIMNGALNMYTQGVDPRAGFLRHQPAFARFMKSAPSMKVHAPPPLRWANLVFTAFSGSHQDAISKGVDYMQNSGTTYLGGSVPAHRPGGCGPASTSPLSASTASRARAARRSLCSRTLATSCPRPCTRNSAPSVKARLRRGRHANFSPRRFSTCSSREYLGGQISV